jgi:hypothetical protein
MNIKRFNLKANFPTNIVFDLDIEEVFGPSSKGFKTINLHDLHPELKELLKLYW